MIINPKKIIKDKVITPVNKKQIQPNSIDLTIKSVRLIEGGVLTERGATPWLTEMLQNQFFTLRGNKAYDIIFNEYVEVPENMVGFIVCRSSLNRIGAFITSGLYDSGFKNYVGAVLRTNNAITIQGGTRIATMYFIKAEAAHKYNGQYQDK